MRVHRALSLLMLALALALARASQTPHFPCTLFHSPYGLNCHCVTAQAVHLSLEDADQFYDVDFVTLSNCTRIEINYGAFFGSTFRRLTVEKVAALRFDTFLPNTTQQLTLSDIGRIETVGDNVFANQPNLLELTIRNASLASLPTHTLVDLSISALRLENLVIDRIDHRLNITSISTLHLVLIQNCTFTEAIPLNALHFTVSGQISLQSNRFLGPLYPNAITVRSPRVYVTNNTFYAPVARHGISIHHLDQTGAFLQFQDNEFREIAEEAVFFPMAINGDYAVVNGNTFPCAAAPQCARNTAWLLRELRRVVRPAARCQSLFANACNRSGVVRPMFCAMRDRKPCDALDVTVAEEFLDACSPGDDKDVCAYSPAAVNRATVSLLTAVLLLLVAFLADFPLLRVSRV